MNAKIRPYTTLKKKTKSSVRLCRSQQTNERFQVLLKMVPQVVKLEVDSGYVHTVALNANFFVCGCSHSNFAFHQTPV